MFDSKNNKIYSIIMLVIGSIGLICTSLFILSKYKTAESVGETMKIMIYSFIPFIISFVAIKFGIKGLSNRNIKK